jgi:hypothetical protein
MLLAGWLETVTKRMSWSMAKQGRRRKSARVFRPVAADQLEDRTVLSAVDFALSSGKTPKAALPISFDSTRQASYLATDTATVKVDVTAAKITITEDGSNLARNSRVAFVGIDATPTIASLGAALPDPNNGSTAILQDLTDGASPTAGKVALIALAGTVLDVSSVNPIDATAIRKGPNPTDPVVALLFNVTNRTLAQQVVVNLGVDAASRYTNIFNSSTAFATKGSGNKVVAFSSLTINNGVEVVTGNGTDFVAFEDVTVNGTLGASAAAQPLINGLRGTVEVVTNGSGEGDVVYFTGNVAIQNDLRISTEDGADDIYLDGSNSFRTGGGSTGSGQISVGEDLLISSGGGNDIVHLGNAIISGESLITTGNGDDILVDADGIYSDSAQFALGNGNDTAHLTGSSFEGIEADKIFANAANPYLDASLILSGQSGIDLFALDGVSLSSTPSGPPSSATSPGAFAFGGTGSDSAFLRNTTASQISFENRPTFDEATENVIQVPPLGSPFPDVPARAVTRQDEIRQLFGRIVVPQSGSFAGTTPENVTLTQPVATGLTTGTGAQKSLIGEALSGTSLLASTSGARVQAVQLTPRGTVTVNADGSFTFVPNPDVNNDTPLNPPTNVSPGGPLAFRYVLDNGVRYSELSGTATISVTPVNDAPTASMSPPSFSQPSVLVATPVTVPSFLTAIAAGPATALDETTQTLTITVSNSNNSLFTVQPAVDFVAGDTDTDLTFTIAPSTFGTSTVTVTVQDNGGTANGGVDLLTLTFTISILGSF